MTDSLSSLMNAMVDRIDTVYAEDIGPIPEERYWHMIGLYMQVDPVLAHLYKQYCDSKANLGGLLAGQDMTDPMTEIAWDMHDGLRSAIDTRLIELRQCKETVRRVTALQKALSERDAEARSKLKAEKEARSFDNLMAFMVWTGMVMKDAQIPSPLSHDFRQAS